MKTTDIFKNKVVFSFEIFPPKQTNATNTICNTLDELKKLNPDYISITYGAGGSKSYISTFKIASIIKNHYGIESVVHLPCINLTKENVLTQINYLQKEGIENILALRGDTPTDIHPCGDFSHASDMITFIKNIVTLILLPLAIQNYMLNQKIF